MKNLFVFIRNYGMLSFLYVPLVFSQNLQNRTFKGIIPAPDPAQVVNGKNISIGGKIQDGTIELTDVPLIIIYFIDIVTKLAGTIAVIFIIYGGFQLMFSGATEDKQAAKTTLKWAILGLIITFSAWVIVNFVQTQLTS